MPPAFSRLCPRDDRRSALPRRYLSIGALSLGSALIIVDGGVANIALPTIARDLHVGSSAVVSIVTVYQLMLVMLLLPFAGVPAGLAFIARACSLARLRPSIRNPGREETQDVQPAAQVR